MLPKVEVVSEFIYCRPYSILSGKEMFSAF